MVATLLLLLAAQFPSANDTGWMEPAAFHLLLGESKDHVRAEFERRGWTLERGETEDSLLHLYDDSKSVVMDFDDGRLVSVRFELVSFRPQLAEDWKRVKSHLREKFGDPEVDHPLLLVQNTTALTVHAVLQDSTETELGKSGAGMIIVRYFVPASSAAAADTSR